MAVKIRLFRVGQKKQPYYRIVAKDARTPRQGSYLENLGHFNPLADPEEVTLNEERLRHWLGNGAIPTETVARIIALTFAGTPARRARPFAPTKRSCGNSRNFSTR